MANPAAAWDIAAGEASGKPGDTLGIRLTVDGLGPDAEYEISGRIKLGGPSIFIPLYAMPEGLALDQHSDSLYTFSGMISSNNNEIDIYGLALAGADTVCEMIFHNIYIDSIVAGEATGRILVDRQYHQRPYIRFLDVGNNYPNPVWPGQSTRWSFRLDQASDIDVKIYDNAGRAIHSEKFRHESGAAEYIYTPPIGISAGVYWIRFKTDVGNNVRRFIILK
ncbi:MAG: T9SS type A sorting domain-containing protein [Candidatus Kapaibacterium sp.]